LGAGHKENEKHIIMGIAMAITMMIGIMMNSRKGSLNRVPDDEASHSGIIDICFRVLTTTGGPRHPFILS
jgi:hypothetical protein